MGIDFKVSTKLPKEAMEIRTTVFVKEQGFVDEFSEDDNRSIHILILVDDKAIGTSRIIYSEKHSCYCIGRFAILKEYRGQGYGAKLIKFTEEEIVRRFGHIRIGIGAQKRAKLFYEKMGYIDMNEPYLDEGYPHYWMSKEL